MPLMRTRAQLIIEYESGDSPIASDVYCFIGPLPALAPRPRDFRFLPSIALPGRVSEVAFNCCI